MPKFLVEMNDEGDGTATFADLESPYYIRVADGEYKDVCFNCEGIEFLEDENGDASLQYSIDLIFVPDHVTLHQDDLGSFAEVSNEILLTILESALLQNESPEDVNEDRNADSE